MMGGLRFWLLIIGCSFIGWIIFDAYRKRSKKAVDFSSLSLDQRSEYAAAADVTEMKAKTGDQPEYGHVSEPIPLPVLALSVLALDEKGFDAAQFHHIVQSMRMSWTDNGFYQQHYNHDPSQQVEFTLVSIAEPGSFMTDRGEFKSIPGVLLFMGGFQGHYTLRGFEDMLNLAKLMSERLGGQIADAQRKPLSSQSLERLRQQAIKIEKTAA